tara:strand:+ start:610 stop:969 length:360 start_codon:yes stop_codon:yes gene_type:complete
MKKSLPKVTEPKLPPNVAVFQDHLALGLECFDLDWFDFRPHTCHNKEYGDGLLFSQLDKKHSAECAGENSLIVSNEGLHLPNKKILPFSNEQPPTKMALLVLSAMVTEQPLHFECPECD